MFTKLLCKLLNLTLKNRTTNWGVLASLIIEPGQVNSASSMSRCKLDWMCLAPDLPSLNESRILTLFFLIVEIVDWEIFFYKIGYSFPIFYSIYYLNLFFDRNYFMLRHSYITSLVTTHASEKLTIRTQSRRWPTGLFYERTITLIQSWRWPTGLFYERIRGKVDDR